MKRANGAVYSVSGFIPTPSVVAFQSLGGLVVVRRRR
jgi:hypothetical protein